jgi:hypothetical protein
MHWKAIMKKQHVSSRSLRDHELEDGRGAPYKKVRTNVWGGVFTTINWLNWEHGLQFQGSNMINAGHPFLRMCRSDSFNTFTNE